MEKVPRLAAKDYTFNPTIYIPHIGKLPLYLHSSKCKKESQ